MAIIAKSTGLSTAEVKDYFDKPRHIYTGVAKKIGLIAGVLK